MLGTYVVALLKNNSALDRLRATCLNQLDVFLGPDTAAFVDDLFAYLDHTGMSKAVPEVTTGGW